MRSCNVFAAEPWENLGGWLPAMSVKLPFSYKNSQFLAIFFSNEAYLTL